MIKNLIIAVVVVLLGVGGWVLYGGGSGSSSIPDISLWMKSEGNNISFSYPERFESLYVIPQAWPPILEIASYPYECPEGERTLPTKEIGKISKRTIGGTEYCRQEKIGAAAGSAYHQFVYETIYDGKHFSLAFSLQYPNCNNFATDDEQNMCREGQSAFDVDSLVGRLMKTTSVR